MKISLVLLALVFLALGFTGEVRAQDQNIPSAVGPRREIYSQAWKSYLAGDYAKALARANRGLAADRASNSQAGIAEALNLIGTVSYKQGNYRQALGYYLDAEKAAEAANYRFGLGRDTSSLGSTYYRLGEYSLARQYYEKSLQIRRELGNNDEIARALNDLANVYQQLGEFQQALNLRKQALTLWQQTGSQDGLADVLNDIGWTYETMHDYSPALSYLQRSLAIDRQINLSWGVLDGTDHIGLVYLQMGRLEEARANLQQAYDGFLASKNDDDLARSLNHLGDVFFKMSDYPTATDKYEQALEIELIVQNRPVQAVTFSSLMLAWEARKSPSLAIFYGKQAIDLFQQMRRDARELGPDLEKSFLETNSQIYRHLADLLVSQGRFPEAQQVLDMLKVEEFSEYTQTRGGADSPSAPVTLISAEASANEEFENAESEITAQGHEYAELNAKSSLSPGEQDRLKLLDADLTAAKDRMQTFFNHLYQDFGQSDAANERRNTVSEKTSSLEGIVGDLGEGTVALYTLVLDDKSEIIVITPDTTVAREVPITRADLRAKVFSFAGALAAHKPDPEIQAKAQDLYKLLISPIEKDLAGAQAQTLVWSLDDALRYIPMAALYDGRQYLVERYQNVEITTASIGNLKDEPKVAIWSGLAMGVSKDYAGLGALDAVPGELKSVVHTDAVPDSHGPLPGTILLNDAFTETGMEDALRKRPPLVHIASHYKFAPGNDTQSYLLLGGKDIGGEGYRLTLADITREKALDFKGVELLTLSGCQTALGSNAGNGLEIDSLGIAAQRNHAKAVMASLWEVEDSSVGQLMSTFYKTWITTPGMIKAEALRRAQLSLLHGTNPIPATTPQSSSANATTAPYSNPYYWAPFILIGNWK
jgi:CHAT domain-containing protein